MNIHSQVLRSASIVKSWTVRGDIGVLYDSIKQTLTDVKFAEVSSKWPTHIELTRGKGGLLAKSIADCKTVLKVSLKQASENVDLLFDYTFNIPQSYLDDNNMEIEKEFLKIKHSVIDAASLHKAKEDIICDVCLSPIKKGEKFCSNCGRSARTEKTRNEECEEKLEVVFDPTKISFGQKVLDDLLYGGIPNTSAVLITSPACEEKDVIVNRFIETGLDQEENVACLSSNGFLIGSTKALEKESFRQIICNSQADLIKVNGPDKNIIKVKGIEHLTELSLALTTMLNSITTDNDKPRRFVIDILSDLLLSNQSVNTRKWLRETITKIKSKNFTILATLNPHMHSKEGVNALLDLFDGQIDLSETENQGRSIIQLRVKRMSNTRYSSKVIDLVKDSFIQKEM